MSKPTSRRRRTSRRSRTQVGAERATRPTNRVPAFEPAGSAPGMTATIEIMSVRVNARQPARHPDDAGFNGHTIAEIATVEASRGENGAVHRGPFKRGAQSRPEPPPRVVITTMPFGQHRGKPWSEIPKDYLVWVLRWSPGDVEMSIRAFLGLPAVEPEEEE